MSIFWLVVIIFVAEIINSFCADSRGKAVVRGQAGKALIHDLIASIITVTIPFLIYVVEKDLRFAIPAVIASVIGTYFATIGVYFMWRYPFFARRVKKKSIYRKKFPFSSA